MAKFKYLIAVNENGNYLAASKRDRFIEIPPAFKLGENSNYACIDLRGITPPLAPNN